MPTGVDNYSETTMLSSQITSLMRRINALEAGVLTSTGTMVLIWPSTSPTFTDLAAVYSGMGLTVHDSGTWSADIDDYGLIFVFGTTSDPSWFSTVTGSSWGGLICLCGENTLVGSSTNTWISTNSGLTGITVIDDIIDIGFSAGTAESDQLTTGCSNIYYAVTSQVSGGTTLSKTVTGAHPWLAKGSSGNITWVISGDDDHLSNSAGAVASNTTFIQNLWTYRGGIAYTQTTFNSYTSAGTPTSLGTPDGGVSIPGLTSLRENETDADLSRLHITEMRTALEALAPSFNNPGTGNPYNMTNGSADNVYFVSMGDRSAYGATGGAQYTWTRTSAQMLASFCYGIDIGEIHEIVTQLEGS